MVNEVEVAGETVPASVFISVCALKFSDEEVGPGFGKLPVFDPAHELIASKKTAMKTPVRDVQRFSFTKAYREL